jgi:hypothetical protein
MSNGVVRILLFPENKRYLNNFKYRYRKLKVNSVPKKVEGKKQFCCRNFICELNYFLVYPFENYKMNAAREGVTNE